MKTINILLLSASLLTSTSGYCSYIREYYENYSDTEMDTAIECLLVIDLIKNEKNKEKKNHYKRDLEIKTLVILDKFNYKLENFRKDLSKAKKKRDSANTDKEREKWQNSILDTEAAIKQLESHYSKIEEFLKYT